MTTTERVARVLVDEGGYRELPKPLKIGSLSLDFTHAFVAGNKANDLVIVIELKSDTADSVVVRKVQALTRALDVLRSRRSVTAILTTGQATSQTLYSISRVCRVLPVGAPTGPKADDAVRDWLAVLLPLHQPPAVENLVDWQGDIRRSLSDDEMGPFLDELMRVAPTGQSSVEDVLRGNIRTVVEVGLSEGHDE